MADMVKVAKSALQMATGELMQHGNAGPIAMSFYESSGNVEVLELPTRLPKHLMWQALQDVFNERKPDHVILVLDVWSKQGPSEPKPQGSLEGQPGVRSSLMVTLMSPAFPPLTFLQFYRHENSKPVLEELVQCNGLHCHIRPWWKVTVH